MTTPAQSPSGPPTSRERWSWTQFACGTLASGVAAFLYVSPPLDEFWVHFIKTLAIAVTCGVLAGRFGDTLWERLLRLLHWS